MRILIRLIFVNKVGSLASDFIGFLKAEKLFVTKKKTSRREVRACTSSPGRAAG